ncbi:3771_t:CDS:2, partial [Funneliformis caledonium]
NLGIAYLDNSQRGAPHVSISNFPKLYIGSMVMFQFPKCPISNWDNSQLWYRMFQFPILNWDNSQIGTPQCGSLSNKTSMLPDAAVIYLVKYCKLGVAFLIFPYRIFRPIYAKIQKTGGTFIQSHPGEYFTTVKKSPTQNMDVNSDFGNCFNCGNEQSNARWCK